MGMPRWKAIIMTRLSCENSRPSLLPTQVVFCKKDATWAGSEERWLFTQAITTPANSFRKFYIQR